MTILISSAFIQESKYLWINEEIYEMCKKDTLHTHLKQDSNISNLTHNVSTIN